MNENMNTEDVEKWVDSLQEIKDFHAEFPLDLLDDASYTAVVVALNLAKQGKRVWLELHIDDDEGE